MDLQSYQDLEVWRKTINLVVLFHQITKSFPRNEIYSKKFLHYMSIAYGSLAELETLIQDETKLKQLADKTAEIGRMINNLRRSIKEKLAPDRRSP